jgi:hypothetical protein
MVEREDNFKKNLTGKYKFDYIEPETADATEALRDDIMKNLLSGMRLEPHKTLFDWPGRISITSDKWSVRWIGGMKLGCAIGSSIIKSLHWV